MKQYIVIQLGDGEHEPHIFKSSTEAHRKAIEATKETGIEHIIVKLVCEINHSGEKEINRELGIQALFSYIY